MCDAPSLGVQTRNIWVGARLTQCRPKAFQDVTTVDVRVFEQIQVGAEMMENNEDYGAEDEGGSDAHTCQ